MFKRLDRNAAAMPPNLSPPLNYYGARLIGFTSNRDDTKLLDLYSCRFRLDFAAEQDSWQKPERLLLTTEQRAGKKVQGSTSDYDSILRSIDLKIDLIAADSLNSQHLDQLLPVYSPLYTPSQVSVHTSKQATCHTLILCDKPQQTA